MTTIRRKSSFGCHLNSGKYSGKTMRKKNVPRGIGVIEFWALDAISRCKWYLSFKRRKLDYAKSCVRLIRRLREEKEEKNNRCAIVVC